MPELPSSSPNPLPETGAIALTVNETLDAMGISRRRLYQEIGEGRIKARKLGRRTLIEVDELKRWLKELPHMPAGRAA